MVSAVAHSPLLDMQHSVFLIASNLHVFIDEGQIFISFYASLLPAVISPIPQLWNPVLETD
jgi:hypothetical protein